MMEGSSELPKYKMYVPAIDLPPKHLRDSIRVPIKDAKTLARGGLVDGYEVVEIEPLPGGGSRLIENRIVIKKDDRYWISIFVTGMQYDHPDKKYELYYEVFPVEVTKIEYR